MAFPWHALPNLRAWGPWKYSNCRPGVASLFLSAPGFLKKVLQKRKFLFVHMCPRNILSHCVLAPASLLGQGDRIGLQLTRGNEMLNISEWGIDTRAVPYWVQMARFRTCKLWIRKKVKLRRISYFVADYELNLYPGRGVSVIRLFPGRNEECDSVMICHSFCNLLFSLSVFWEPWINYAWLLNDPCCSVFWQWLITT